MAAGAPPGAFARDFFDSFSPRAYVPRGYYTPYFDGRSRFNDGYRDPLVKKTAEELRKAPKPPPNKGPLLIAVSLASQRLTLYDDGVAVAHSPISSGTVSNPTPTGLFSVIQKHRWHRSNLYSAAPMPFMQRITWSGVALHAGVLPGYPASHGCIRLPSDFAVRLFRTTQTGVRVVVTQREIAPVEISHPRLFALPANGVAEDKPALRLTVGSAPSGQPPVVDGAAAPLTPPTVDGAAQTSADPTPKIETKIASVSAVAPDTGAATPDSPPVVEKPLRPGPVSVFVSRKEQRLYVRKGFEPLFDMPVVIQNPEQPIGTHLFVAMTPSDGHSSPRWMVVSPTQEPAHAAIRADARPRKGKAAPPAPVPRQLPTQASAALDRIELPAEAVQRISELMSVGAALTVSDEGLGPETGKETDFVVLTNPPQPSKRAKRKSNRYDFDRFWRSSRRWF